MVTAWFGTSGISWVIIGGDARAFVKDFNLITAGGKLLTSPFVVYDSGADFMGRIWI
jgi:hypothetical protein